MANQLSALLEQWYPQRDECDWVLGTVYRTEGPSYRKAGAMMLFNSLGQQFGMLSGGCLESDIQTHARRVMQTGSSLTLCYDGSDEDDLSFQLGIGCGGTVYIMLHRIDRENDYQQLDQLYEHLRNRVSGLYYQQIPVNGGRASSIFLPLDQHRSSDQKHRITQSEGQNWLVTAIDPDPHLLVVGGGVDAQPLVAMAKQLGWEVSLWDPRPANARREHFMLADRILRDNVSDLNGYISQNRVNAAVLMSHNVELDAAALQAVNGAGLEYMALLGPHSRKQKVLRQARLKTAMLQPALAGPAGMPLGGELPESIALSILAECHRQLHLGEASQSRPRSEAA
ncbi:XdhC family protein [Neptuniibacter halophilus]|uniref:XdhC family protein n=1 Tax=Neptuniibacter halophilus TaxID=651666 RepID=UPI0025732146|nr:XdhC/CoxI family protein [Neptuniibacter halophilus]